MEYGDQPDICLWKITNSLAILRLRKPLKTSSRLAGHGIWTRDLPNASLVRYHGATSLGYSISVYESRLLTSTQKYGIIVLETYDVVYRQMTNLLLKGSNKDVFEGFWSEYCPLILKKSEEASVFEVEIVKRGGVVYRRWSNETDFGEFNELT